MPPSDLLATPATVAAFVISLTTFGQNGELDEAAFRAHLERLAAAGIGVYVAGGGSGEAYSMSAAERRRVVEIAVDTLHGRVPIRSMGVEPRTADEMIEFVEVAAACGVDAAQIYSLDVGHGEYPTDEEITTYFTDILDRVTIPCVLSTHRSVNYVVPVPTVAKLARRYEHVIEINCTRDDFYLEALVNAVAGRAGVFVGGEMQGLNAFAIGASGYLSSVGNLIPNTVMEVVTNYNNGELAAAATAYASVMRVAGLIYTRGGIRMTKALLRHFGLPGGSTRKPRLPLPAEAVTEVAAVIRSLGLDHREGW